MREGWIDIPEKREKEKTIEKEVGSDDEAGGGGEESRVVIANGFETFLKREKQSKC